MQRCRCLNLSFTLAVAYLRVRSCAPNNFFYNFRAQLFFLFTSSEKIIGKRLFGQLFIVLRSVVLYLFFTNKIEISIFSPRVSNSFYGQDSLSGIP